MHTRKQDQRAREMQGSVIVILGTNRVARAYSCDDKQRSFIARRQWPYERGEEKKKTGSRNGARRWDAAGLQASRQAAKAKGVVSPPYGAARPPG